MIPDEHDEPSQQQRAAANSHLLYAPWEQAFQRVLTPFEEFIHRQTTSGLLLMVSALLALLLANSGLAEAYQRIIHLPVGIVVGAWRLEMSLHHWVNDGLMAFFFFVVGLELKREMLVGELANLRQAALPVVAALGGMAVPALIFLAFNTGGDAIRGWGIPMATDIAFSVGALVLLAARVPRGLITFLVALAIADDLGAVLVIALFYTSELSLPWLAAAAGLVGALMTCNLAGIRRTMPYFLIAVALWFALLQSGVHATLAGVLGAFCVPVRSRYEPQRFNAELQGMATRFEASRAAGSAIMVNDEMRATVQALESGAIAMQAPLQRLERIWHLPVAYLVIPVFALCNAGIPLEAATLTGAIGHPVAQGVVVGLVLGKFIGVTGASWLALCLGIGQLPAQTRMAQIAAVGLLAGIGFTMSIFIAELAYAHQPAYLLMAKTGIIAASLIGGAAGTAWLWWLGAPAAAARSTALPPPDDRP